MTNELIPGKKKTGNISWWLKFSDKKPLVCHGHFWLCHGQNFRNCHGHFSFVTGIFWPILSRATRPVSRAKFGVFCHGHFYKVTGTFSTNVTGKPKSVTGKKKNTVLGAVFRFWIIWLKLFAVSDQFQKKDLKLFETVKVSLKLAGKKRPFWHKTS